MKVLDLCCANQHRFEGWFKSEADFESQMARDLIGCPLCNSMAVTRMLSAPRLNLSGASAPKTAAPAAGAAAGMPAVASGPAEQSQAMGRAQAAWFAAVRQIVEKSENVGDRFADEARKMHYDEAPVRSIRGVASRDEMHELLDEGIDVLSLPIPAALKDPLQ
jgi:hypothetical protein